MHTSTKWESVFNVQGRLHQKKVYQYERKPSQMVERFPLLAPLCLSVLAFDHFVPFRLHALRPLPCFSGGYTLSPCKKARNIQAIFS